jgi:hypothetical protein
VVTVVSLSVNIASSSAHCGDPAVLVPAEVGRDLRRSRGDTVTNGGAAVRPLIMAASESQPRDLTRSGEETGRYRPLVQWSGEVAREPCRAGDQGRLERNVSNLL